MQNYSTSQIAKIVNVHPNTVRFYEDVKLLPAIARKENGYRVYTDFHVAQLKLIRIAFDSEIISGNLRNMTIEIIKLAAYHHYEEAIIKTCEYKNKINAQKENAEEAIEIIENMISNKKFVEDIYNIVLTRKEVATKLGISTDVLRDWERNGLIDIPRGKNRYRMYGAKEIMRLKVIRTLRNAHYSMMSILRMLSQMSKSSSPNLKEIINTPLPSEDIVGVTDQFITSLVVADKNADKILKHIEKMKKYK